jgi:hypothetical protein
MATLEIAHRLLELGLSVIPVPLPRAGVAPGNLGDGKVPAIAWREYQTRLPTAAELHRWFSREPQNLAVITGAISGVVVIDADAPEALHWCTTHLPYTDWQTETARGFHLWYAHPGDRVTNRARIETRDGRLAIDVRADGGYVIAPGSIHASGVEYYEAGDWSTPRASLPRFSPDWLQRPSRVSPSQRPAVAPQPSGDMRERARRYLAAIPRPEIGHGSDAATYYAACRLTRGFALSEREATDLLWEWAGGRAGWTWDWIAAKVAHAATAGTEPIGAMR